MLRKLSPVVFAVFLAFPLGASAQTIDTEEGLEFQADTPDEVIPWQPNNMPPRAYYSGPRVYGWSSDMPRPSCGEFRYWNGEQCVDARVVPPDID